MFCEEDFQHIHFGDLQVGDILADTGSLTCLVMTPPVNLTGVDDLRFICVNVYVGDDRVEGSADPAYAEASFAIIDAFDAVRRVAARGQHDWYPPYALHHPEDLLEHPPGRTC